MNMKKASYRLGFVALCVMGLTFVSPASATLIAFTNDFSVAGPNDDWTGLVGTWSNANNRLTGSAPGTHSGRAHFTPETPYSLNEGFRIEVGIVPIAFNFTQGPMFHVQDADNYLLLRFRPDDNNKLMQLINVVNGTIANFASFSFTNDYNWTSGTVYDMVVERTSSTNFYFSINSSTMDSAWSTNYLAPTWLANTSGGTVGVEGRINNEPGTWGLVDSYTLYAIPEPASMALFTLSGLTLLIARRRLRR